MKFKRLISVILSITLVIGIMLQSGLLSAIANQPLGNEQEQSYESPYILSNNWIWSTASVTINSVSYFRRDYNFKEIPKSIDIKTSAHNYMKFYLNGKIMTGLCSPATSTIPENKNYLHYTLTGQELTSWLDAANPKQAAFAAAVQYLGDSGMNYINGVPGFWAQIVVTYEDGSTDTIVSDSSWSALANTPYKNNTPSQESRRMTGQIDYDAQKMPDPVAFAKYGYDTSSYTSGTWVSAVPAAAESFTWKMREQGIPEGAVHEFINPTPVGVQQVGVQVFDVGRIVAGFPRIKISAPAGTRICLRYSEDLLNGRVKHNVANEGSETYCDYYTFSGNGVEEFCPDFTYKAFRYVEIVGLTQMISADDIQVEWASSGIVNTSSFNSSDDITNKIYQACINTQYNNVQNMPVDCPHREQSQYLGDSQMQYGLLSYAFSDFNSINYKTLLDFSNSQLADGSFPFISPTNVSSFDMKIPEYDLRYPDLLYQYYWYSGKTDALNEFYDTAKRVTECYYKFVDGTGLVAKTPYWSISDWPSPTIDDSGKYITVFNLHMYDALNKMAKISQLLGKTQEAADYAKRAENISVAITTNLINPKTGMYLDSSSSTLTNPGVTAFAISLEQAPESLRMQELDNIAETELKATSVLPSKVILTLPVLQVLLQGNDSHKAAAYEIMTRTTGMEWGKMVSEGYQTVWEGFEDVNSHSHAWDAYPAKMFLQYLVGISYNNVNYSGVTIKPYLPDKLNYVEGSLQTPDGSNIAARLDRNTATSQTLTINTEVASKIGIPRYAMQNTVVSLNNTVLFENGVATGSVAGVTYDSNDAQYIYFNVAAGSYSFASSAKPAGPENTYTLSIPSIQGGTILVDGSAVTLPYTKTVENGKTVTVEAVPNSGMQFDGWSGTYGSFDQEMNFTMGCDTIINASFSVRTNKVYHTVTVNAPPDSGLYVKVGDKTIDLPASIPVVEGETVTLVAGQHDDSKYNFVAWSGDVFNSNKSISLTADKDINLEVIGEYKAVENLALGKKVTSNSSYSEGTLWGPANLTDGYTAVGPSGQLGFTSNAYDTQDISATPHEFIIDLGSNRNFDTLVLYPRADKTADDGGSLCFPETYKIQSCLDGSDVYNEGTQITNGGNPNGKPVSISLSAQTGRYIKITTTKLGPPVMEGAALKYRVQLAEFEVYNRNSANSEFTLNIAGKGNGTVKVNGIVKSLPFSGQYTKGTHIVVEPVAATNFRSSGFTGDLEADSAPMYIQMNRDYNLTTNFISILAAKSANLAAGKTVTAANSDGAEPQWGISHLTDGVNVSTGSSKVDGNKGYTSISYASQDVSNQNLWVEIDLGKDTDFHQVVLYPRTDVAGANGGTESPNFPVDYRIQYKMDGDSIYRTIGDFKDVANPQGQPCVLNFSIQNARYIRIIPTKLGSPAIDDVNGAKPYRFQLCEVEVYAVPSAPDNMAVNATISASDMAANAGAWSLANLVDGKLRSEGRGIEGGIKGFTSAARANGNADISSSPFTLEFTFDSAQKFNQLVMYPRSDVDANTQNSGDSANFPVDYQLQVKNESTGQYETIYTATNAPNPKMAPVEINFDTVTAKSIRLVVTKLGMPSFDEISKSRYVQLAEVRISNLSTEAPNIGAIKLSAKDSPTVISTATDLMNLIADVTPSDLATNDIHWSIETEDGFVSDIASLIGTNGTTPKLHPALLGSAYVVARFANGLPVMDRLPITIIAPANKTILQMVVDRAHEEKAAGNVDNVIPSIKIKFNNALTIAEALLADPNATQQQVDAAWVSLIQAIQSLSFIAGDKTQFAFMVDLANKIDLSDYVDAGQSTFVDALSKATDVMNDNDALKADVDKAQSELLNAMMALRFKADKDTLQKVLNQASGMNLSGYTAASVNVFNTAKANAAAVYNDANASVDSVANAVTTLQNAIKNLTLTVGTGTSSTSTTNPHTGDTAPLAGLVVILVAASVTVVCTRRRRS